MRFCWTTVGVSNLDRSLAFYQEIVGLKLNRRIKPNENMELAFLGEGDTELELMFNSNNSEIRYGKDISIGFMVDSTEKLLELLASRGIPVLEGPVQPNPLIKFTFVQDPDGLKIQFVEELRKSGAE